jgi:Tol biopolymer transport system component
MDTNGGHVKQLTFNDLYTDGHPRWSEDGKKGDCKTG